MSSWKALPHYVAKFSSSDFTSTLAGCLELDKILLNLLCGELGLLSQHLHVPGGEGAGLRVLAGLVIPHMCSSCSVCE